ncbi:MAG: fumarylacetoacetate hydrolase family protein [Candidatus Thermoplasmatota archaeon]|jgi:fumarylacetoacetate (FAA) hydrolase|nr:fumarylacetoacetate hydrolase family protein [Candidatus Thermoplasmatota archaeon]MCL5789785.1 fumarylacetoacetate hydrolase family protein [Candidatus Thermoplasmatota archaeon]
MKIARIETDGKIRNAVLTGEEEFLPIDESINFYDIKETNPEAHEDKLQKFGPSDLRVPLPEVKSIRDFYAFEDHVRKARARRGLEMVQEWYDVPAYYYSGTSMLYPSGSQIPHPSFSAELDYEMEVAVVIGKGGMNIRREEAFSHILGFMLANDWSARDIQRKEMKIGLGPSKSKDFATSLGPYITTTDDLEEFRETGDRFDMPVEAYVNGKRYSSGNVRDMHWSFSELIEYASNGTMLREGDVIMSGTVSTGCILELGPEEHGWLKKGDNVSIRSPALGELTNEVI